jgi:hypothetical protein
MRAELFLERVELRFRRKIAVEQQMNDFLEARVWSEVVDIVSAEGKAAFFALDITKQRAPDDDAFEPAIDYDTGGRQCRVPPWEILLAALGNPWTGPLAAALTPARRSLARRSNNGRRS